jgi:DNA polymerase bacteriophage-type
MRKLFKDPINDLYFYAEAEGGVLLPDLRAGHRIVAGRSYSMVLPSLDFEGYSEAGYFRHGDKVKGVGSQGKGGLPAIGAPVYAEHESTEIISLAYDLKDGKGVRLWIPGSPYPYDLFDHVINAGLLEAWNAGFEYKIWNLVGCRRFKGWPTLELNQMRCAMAKAKAFSLPGGLDNAAEVVGTTKKRKEGKRLINKLCRPVNGSKANPLGRWTPANAWHEYLTMYYYNEGDVQSEDEVASLVPDLSTQELQVWLLDQKINDRGMLVDVETLEAALFILEQAEEKYTAEVQRLTEGQVGSINEVQSIPPWCESRGFHIPDVTKDSVKEALDRDPPSEVRRVLEIRQILGSANVKKLNAFKLQTCRDGRLRDQYKYCGADRTGRFSAVGVQMQNVTAKGPESALCNECNSFFNHTANKECPLCHT